MMNTKFSIFILIIFTAFACKQKQEQIPQNTFAPKVVEAKGFVVPKDSMALPKVILVDESKLKKIKVGKPKVIPTNTNVFTFSNTRIDIIGEPKECTPGNDTFLMPKVTPAIEHPLKAGIPEIVVAKDAYIKDINPQNFSFYTKLQGLKHNLIRCLIQDQSGNLWFGTLGGGVTKYDGKYFTHYTEKEGLSNNSVMSIMQDQSGNLWFGTLGGGISKYDGKYFTNYSEKEGLRSNRVFCIFQDKAENIWIGTDGKGISKYDGKNFTNYTEKEGLSNNYVLSIFQDNHENLWFGTDNGVSKFDGKSFTNYTKKEGIGFSVYGIIQDYIGNLWFGTDGGGVLKYDGLLIEAIESGEKSSIQYQQDLKKINGKFVKTITHYTEKEGLSSNRVFSILQDKNKNYWFGTYGGGLSKLAMSKVEGAIHYTFTNYNEKEGLSNNRIMSILQDYSGNLWFGTFGGGVAKFDGKSFTHFTEKEGLINERIMSILQDQNGYLWFGTDGGGLSKYDGKCFYNYTEKEGLSNNRIMSILQDKSGNIWFGTGGGGVMKYAGIYFTKFTEKEGLNSNYVLSIIQDKSGNIWFATIGGGISKYDGKSFTNFTKKEGLCNNNIFSIIQDQIGNIWASTDGGGASKLTIRIVVDSLKYIVTNYTEKEGLCNNIAMSMILDKAGNLWFGTRFGLCKLNTQKIIKKDSSDIPLFKTFSYEDGFLGIGCNRGAMYEDNTKTIWIGSNDRLTAYHPEGDEPDTIAPNIQLTGIELFNESIQWSNLSLTQPSSKEPAKNNIAKDTSFVLGNGVKVGNFEFNGITNWYGLPENLSLAYNNNYITFNFIGITTKSPQKVKYQYKLEGIDENWSALTNRTEAPYGNLPKGSYTFKVKAMNSEGCWSKEYNYSFTIRPPWWKTVLS